MAEAAETGPATAAIIMTTTKGEADEGDSIQLDERSIESDQQQQRQQQPASSDLETVSDTVAVVNETQCSHEIIDEGEIPLQLGSHIHCQ